MIALDCPSDVRLSRFLRQPPDSKVTVSLPSPFC